MKGTLYLVATPIGNLEDITIRALNVLKEVDLIAAEDTRHTLGLLNHFEISKPLISYYKETEKIKSPILVEKLLNGKNIALVSDAGTPGISDPGEEIVKEAIKNDIKIVAIPGACAFVNALICSGLNTDGFLFLGFLPLNKKNRKQKLDKICNSTETVIIYEAPHKLQSTLLDLKNVIGNRRVVIARELTKIHEEFLSGSIEEIIEGSKQLKGEIIILIEGKEKSSVEDQIDILNNMSLDEHYSFYENEGMEKKDIIKKIAKDRGISKNEVYIHFI